MGLFCIADLHLCESVEKPMDVFGKRWEGYRAKIVENWNNTVGEDDTVIIPGDISWGMTLDEAMPDLALISSLPGKKIILRGNHDYWWQSRSKIETGLMENGIGNISLLQNDAVLFGDKILCGSRGWFPDKSKAPDGADSEKIYAREVIRLKMSFDYARGLNPDLEKLVFLHFPPYFNGTATRPIIDALKENGVKRVFYGHIHNVYDMPPTTSFEGLELTVISADYLNFTPYRII